MVNILFYLLNAALWLAAIPGVSWLPLYNNLPEYKYAFSLLIALLGILGVLVSNKGESLHLLPSFWRVNILVVTAIFGIHYLGGLQAGANIAIIYLIVVFISLSSKPAFSIAAFALIWLSYCAYSLNMEYLVLPGSIPAASNQPLSDLVFPLSQATFIGLVGVLLSTLKSNSILRQSYLSRREQKPGSAKKEEDITKDKATIGISLDQSDTGISGDTQFYTREYLEQQEQATLNSMRDILETVVFFMSRNFKAYSAIGFLAAEGGARFVVNSYVSKSKSFNPKISIQPGKGLVGVGARKPSGFVSGNIKSYPEVLEYYSEAENINSIMVMPIMDTETNAVQGLLVVDSDTIRAFHDEHKELLKRFTQIASAMITNARLTDQVNKQAKWADTMYEITKMLTMVLKVEDVISILTDSLSKIFTNDRIVICIYNPQKKKAQIWNLVGDASGVFRGMEFSINGKQSLYGFVFTHRREVVVHNYQKDTKFIRFEAEDNPQHKPQDIMIAPILDEKQSVIAVVGLESNESGAYSDRELRKLRTMMVNFSTAIARARLYGEMEKLATVDGLTQIANHRKFQEVMTAEIYRAGRYKNKLTLLLMDIDHFKNFNDTYGHPVGDEVLRMVAATLQKAARSTDLVARYGGEEFVVVMIQSDEGHSRIVAERIRQSIEAMDIPHEDKVLKVTVSIGSATFPEDAAEKQALIDNSDKAMYHSKENGRNRVTYFSTIKDQIEKS